MSSVATRVRPTDPEFSCEGPPLRSPPARPRARARPCCLPQGCGPAYADKPKWLLRAFVSCNSKLGGARPARMPPCLCLLRGSRNAKRMFIKILDPEFIRSPRSVARRFDNSRTAANPLGVKIVELCRCPDIEMKPHARLSLRTLNKDQLNVAETDSCRVRGRLLVFVQESMLDIRPTPANAEPKHVAVVRDACVHVIDSKNRTTIENGGVQLARHHRRSCFFSSRGLQNLVRPTDGR